MLVLVVGVLILVVCWGGSWGAAFGLLVFVLRDRGVLFGWLCLICVLVAVTVVLVFCCLDGACCGRFCGLVNDVTLC